MRHDDREPNQLRPIKITRGFTRTAAGSVLIEAGGTTVLCTASVDAKVPDWMAGKGRGWLTAEYNMLPSSTTPRKRRERDGKVDGRTTEIQRLIGRSLRAVVDLDLLGERSLLIDCEVLEADGGTRTASITGAFIALVDALATLGGRPAAADSASQPVSLAGYPLTGSIAAISVGIVDGRPLLDLNYREDFAAAVDMNIVMTGAGQFVELQGSGEEATFSEAELAQLIALGRRGIEQLTAIQRESLGSAWPFPDLR